MIVFVDSNIPMYLVGQEHPNKVTALLVIEKLITDKHKLVSNAEVLQEILHRYKAINRTDAIQPALDCLYGFIDTIYPVTETDVMNAKQVLLSYSKLSARDALHVALLQKYKVKTVFSFDAGFDQVAGVERVYK